MRDSGLAWDAAKSKWLYFYKYNNKYNANGKLIEEIYSIKDVPGTSWNVRYKNSFTYNPLNLLITQERKDWSTTTMSFNNSSITTMNYNSDQTLNNTLVTFWNQSLNKFENSSKVEYTYNANALLIQKLTKLWNTSKSIFENSEKLDIQLNSNGQVTQNILSKWDSAKNAYQNFSKNEYEFNQNGDQISWDLYGSWNGTIYTFHTREEYRCAVISAVDNGFNIKSVNIYPNPCFQQELKIVVEEETNYRLFNGNGIIIQNGQFKTGINQLNFESSLNSGIYLLQINNSCYKINYLGNRN